MIVDTSALLAFFDTDEPDHEAVTAVLANAAEPLVVSLYVVAELDYLVASQFRAAAGLAVLRELTGGAWDLPAIDVEALVTVRVVIERYADQDVSLRSVAAGKAIALGGSRDDTERDGQTQAAAEWLPARGDRRLRGRRRCALVGRRRAA